MTKVQLERIVRMWVPRLGLERWKIEIKWDEAADPDAYASITPSAYYDTATLRFATDFGKWERDMAEQTVVHELLHLTHRDIDEVVNDLDGQLHRDAAILLERRYKQALEQFVDRMAARLVELA